MKLPSRSAGDERGDNGVLQVQGVDQEGVFFVRMFVTSHAFTIGKTRPRTNVEAEIQGFNLRRRTCGDGLGLSVWYW